MKVPEKVFSDYELRTGEHPSEKVRRLGIAIEIGYFTSMGPRALETKQLLLDMDNTQYDTDRERRARWDVVAQTVLDLMTSPK